MQEQDLKKKIEELTRELASRGKLIEAGWTSYRLLAMPVDAGPIQERETRTAFYAGAQHLFSSILSFIDPGGEEPTESDLEKMRLVSEELENFRSELEHRLKVHRARNN